MVYDDGTVIAANQAHEEGAPRSKGCCYDTTFVALAGEGGVTRTHGCQSCDAEWFTKAWDALRQVSWRAKEPYIAQLLHLEVMVVEGPRAPHAWRKFEPLDTVWLDCGDSKCGVSSRAVFDSVLPTPCTGESTSSLRRLATKRKRWCSVVRVGDQAGPILVREMLPGEDLWLGSAYPASTPSDPGEGSDVQ